MILLYITIFQLTKYKIYIGHSKLNSILLSSWLIFSFRGKMSILNLFKTIKMLKLSYHLIKYCINLGLPVWFINFDLTKEYIIKQSALNCGEFYLTRRWIRGLLSNYYVITKAYRKYLIKKEFIDIKRVKEVYDKWFYTRFTWPRAVFISDIKTTYMVSKEAASSRVPMIALVDTNIKAFFYNIPIGSNDDSIVSISFMNNLMTQYIIQCKYKKILVWYYFNRDAVRFQGIIKWLKNLIKLKKKIEYKINVSNMQLPNYINYFTEVNRGLLFFFGRSDKFKLLKKRNQFNNNFNFDKFYNISKILLYNRFKVVTYKILRKKYKIKWKRANGIKKIEGLTLFKSYLNNFIRFTKSTKRFNFNFRKNKKKVSEIFKPFFYFIFFFYLNKFSIVIDSYKKYLYELRNLIKINKIKKKEKKKKKLYNIIFLYRYKTKKKYRFKKWKKNKYFQKRSNLNINKDPNKMSFFFFFWKYLILFLGLKIRIKSYEFKSLSSSVLKI